MEEAKRGVKFDVPANTVHSICSVSASTRTESTCSSYDVLGVNDKSDQVTGELDDSPLTPKVSRRGRKHHYHDQINKFRGGNQDGSVEANHKEKKVRKKKRQHRPDDHHDLKKAGKDLMRRGDEKKESELQKMRDKKTLYNEAMKEAVEKQKQRREAQALELRARLAEIGITKDDGWIFRETMTGYVKGIIPLPIVGIFISLLYIICGLIILFIAIHPIIQYGRQIALCTVVVGWILLGSFSLVLGVTGVYSCRIPTVSSVAAIIKRRKNAKFAAEIKPNPEDEAGKREAEWEEQAERRANNVGEHEPADVNKTMKRNECFTHSSSSTSRSSSESTSSIDVLNTSDVVSASSEGFFPDLDESSSSCSNDFIRRWEDNLRKRACDKEAKKLSKAERKVNRQYAMMKKSGQWRAKGLDLLVIGSGTTMLCLTTHFMAVNAKLVGAQMNGVGTQDNPQTWYPSGYELGTIAFYECFYFASILAYFGVTNCICSLQKRFEAARGQSDATWNVYRPSQDQTTINKLASMESMELFNVFIDPDGRDQQFHPQPDYITENHSIVVDVKALKTSTTVVV